MRLVCPNCGAQYEVDDRVIPDSGRDVQCSSCGHAWYQMPANMDAAEESALAEPEEVLGADDDTADMEPEFEPEPEPDVGSGDEPDGETDAGTPDEQATTEPDVAAAVPRDDAVPEPPTEVAEPETAPDTAPEAAPEATSPEAEPEATAPEAEPEATSPGGDTAPLAVEAAQDDVDGVPEDEDTPLPAGAEGAGLPRRELDQNLRAILQEEVAREMAARAADTEPETTDSQPDAGETEPPAETGIQPGAAQEPSEGFDSDELPDIGPAPTNERDVGVFAAPAAAAAAVDKASRKDLFPDIEEINSTLDSRGLAEDDEEEPAPEGRGSFGRGFFAIIFIAALALALYLVAPKLAESIPALEPALSGYVGAVNGARAGLESLLQRVTDQIDSAE